ncbi:hypothetical protein ACWT_0262 [Actinoplanes sp. SE50]|uniref:FlgD immunoglobulin-like domain containing protein n=1 Tax=unclassified Actinoplanes TaxID=2626549 RepID=UPI00023EBE5A|nr:MULTISPECIES: FlgD immunoglobulin-like domain containing protein [unclassified Actinoplanes]AEV81274.1 hypothetical protein ACPL_377 [Actinoplanes sp. SE50/110]ATO79677.1 hypothetical protein ACWT_0262 [Actinoplanes sp. SE50]SLL97080.1 hypothetical protein ACSP50_0276 [Actinoplanes sp. SE50/110]
MPMTRRGLAATCCSLLALTGISVAAPASATVPLSNPHEVATIPADPPFEYREDHVAFAGRTGYLHSRANGGGTWQWTTYADHTTTTVTTLGRLYPGDFVSAGGDTVYVDADVDGHSEADTVSTLDLGTMTWQHRPRTADFRAVYGDTWYVRSSSATPALRHFAVDGSSIDVPMTGIPAGTASILAVRGDSTGMVIRFGGKPNTFGWQFGLLDLASGKVSPFGGNRATVASSVLLSAGRVALLDEGADTGTAEIFDRAAVLNGTAPASPEPIHLPLTQQYRLALAGNDVLASPEPRGGGVAPAVYRYSADGSHRTLFAQSQPGSGSLTQAEDGAVVVGGADSGDWGIHRITAAGDTRLADLSAKAGTTGVTISQGMVRRVQTVTWAGDQYTFLHLINHHLSEGIDRQVPVDGGRVGAFLCQPAAFCIRTVDGNRYGTSFAAGYSVLTMDSVARPSVDTDISGLTVNDAAVVDAGLEYVVSDFPRANVQVILRAGAGDTDVVQRPITGAALWFNTLWTGLPGKIQPTNVTTRVSSPAIPIGAACTPSELQATDRYVYWSCGTAGPAGVYDGVTKTSRQVPPAQYLLGDGYLVRHDAATGKLIRIDLRLRGTLGRSATLGTIPRGTLADDRNITWAVDKYSGDVAYVDAANTIHVIDTGVARSAPAVVGRPAGNLNPAAGQSSSWSFTLNRPVDVWTATITQNGVVVRTLTGGPADRTAQVTWDGLRADGRPAAAGRYQLTFAAVAGGVSGTPSTATVNVSAAASR